jgi:hypothetical protein
VPTGSLGRYRLRSKRVLAIEKYPYGLDANGGGYGCE